MTDNMIINTRYLCTKILNNIYQLRKNLKELEKLNPELFDGVDPIIPRHWEELLTTDDILEQIDNKIKNAVKIDEKIIKDGKIH